MGNYGVMMIGTHLRQIKKAQAVSQGEKVVKRKKVGDGES